MLKHLEVSNFKSFENPFSLDLIAPELSNPLTLIIGNADTGKSNLGHAIFDINSHIYHGFKQRNSSGFYLNANSSKLNATFKYVFQFGADIVEYFYEKYTPNACKSEELKINGDVIISTTSKKLIVNNLSGAETLTSIGKKFDSYFSAINYVERNTTLKSDDKTVIAFNKLLSFFRGMKLLNEQTLSNTKLKGLNPESVADFEEFLKKLNIFYTLVTVQNYDSDFELKIKFKNKTIDFFDVASKSLKLLAFLFFELRYDDTTFIFLDDFDSIVVNSDLNFEQLLKSYLAKLNLSNIQTLATSQNDEQHLYNTNRFYMQK